MVRNGEAFQAELITTGRVTGKEHTVWLKAVMHDDKLYFSRHRPDGDWFKNAIVNSNVKVRFENKTLKGKAIVVTDEALEDKVSQLKYPGEKRSEEKRVVLEVTPHE